jgi:hypothetical protein
VVTSVLASAVAAPLNLGYDWILNPREESVVGAGFKDLVLWTGLAGA